MMFARQDNTHPSWLHGSPFTLLTLYSPSLPLSPADRHSSAADSESSKHAQSLPSTACDAVGQRPTRAPSHLWQPPVRQQLRTWLPWYGQTHVASRGRAVRTGYTQRALELTMSLAVSTSSDMPS